MLLGPVRGPDAAAAQEREREDAREAVGSRSAAWCVDAHGITLRAHCAAALGSRCDPLSLAGVIHAGPRSPPFGVHATSADGEQPQMQLLPRIALAVLSSLIAVSAAGSASAATPAGS